MTPVAGLFFEAENRTVFPKTNFLKGNLDKSRVHFTSELLVPSAWILKSSTTIFSQSMFLSTITTAFSKKKGAKPSFDEITLLETRSKFPWKKIVRFSDSKKSPATGVIPAGENKVETTVVYVLQLLMFVAHVRINMNTLVRVCVSVLQCI